MSKTSFDADQNNLSGEMQELVEDINVFIDHYTGRAAEISQAYNNARTQAAHDLAEAEKVLSETKSRLAQNRITQETAAQTVIKSAESANDWALGYFRKNEVSPEGSAHPSPAALKPGKKSLEEAQKLFTAGDKTVRTLNEIQKPKGTGGLFGGFAIAGLVIGGCAAANAARGDGGPIFMIIMTVAIGIAGFITFARYSMWKSLLRARFSTWLEKKRYIDGYANSAIEFANGEYQRELDAAETKFRNAEARNTEANQKADSENKSALALLRQHSVPLIRKLKADCSALYSKAGYAVLDWDSDKWIDWQPTITTSFAACMGRLVAGPIQTAPTHNDLDIRFELPAIVPFASGKEGKCLLFQSAGEAKESAARSAQSLITRLLATTPPAKVKFTFIDPVGLGQNVSGFMELADYDDSLVSGKAWTEPAHIEQQLLELTEHMETVIQKYLRNDFDSIEAYNANAGEIAEAYRVLVVWDFPVNFSETSARRLISIAENGPRCGVYTVVIMDTSAEKRLPYGFTPADLQRTSNLIVNSPSNGFVWMHPAYQRHQLVLDSPPRPELAKHIVGMVGAIAKTALNVQVPYEKLLNRAKLNDGSWWQKTTENIIEAPLGPHGANKIQSLVLGEKTAHHAIIVGRTGSGKSNLMHVIITSLALSYSPDEIELYLVDFKQGVEFKPYAVTRLAHARVIAIESEREFGVSVLEGLDRELHRRGELFRAANVSNIGDYRRNVGQLSRILLLVDEFQEFFSQDDGISSQARIILDRLVRQGRSQGIHVMLGSQTLKGASDLPHSIISQMGVRIALQCTEADARQIMGDDNLVNRQLTRPGEAIYNSESGEVQANKLFQVALFTEKDRETYLNKIAKLANTVEREFAPPIVFEGNEPANLETCLPLQNARAADSWPSKLKGADAWLGEPIAIRPPVTARFRRQGGSNVLIVARDEQQGVGAVIASLVGLMTQYSPDLAEFLIVNMTTADSEWNEIPNSLLEFFPHDIKIVGRKNLTSVLESLVALEEQRANDDTSDHREVFLVFLGLHRIRDLRDDSDGVSSYFKSADDSGADPKALFARIMREGPESGIHVVAWCDAYANVERIDRRLIGEFSMRVAGPMSNDDSQRVVDDSAASKLDRAHRAIFFDEERPGQLDKFRPYALPQIDWLRKVGDELRARNGKAHLAAGA